MIRDFNGFSGRIPKASRPSPQLMAGFDARVCSYQRASTSVGELGFGLDNCSRFWTESHGNGMRRCLFRKEPNIIEFKPESLFAVMAA
tara:strand:+ start:1476 stop:1739 length:264 start_codon:yes stop_codon:yes gene_type:complete